MTNINNYSGRAGPDLLGRRSLTITTSTTGFYWFTKGDLWLEVPLTQACLRAMI